MRRPLITFVLVATGAAVEQVFRAIITPFGHRLKVINREFTAHICFRDAAKLTGEVGSLPNLLSDFSRDCHIGWLCGWVSQLAAKCGNFASQSFIFSSDLLYTFRDPR